VTCRSFRVNPSSVQHSAVSIQQSADFAMDSADEEQLGQLVNALPHLSPTREVDVNKIIIVFRDVSTVASRHLPVMRRFNI